LVSRLLEKNTLTRISAAQTLQHPWVKQIVEVKKKNLKGALNNIKKHHEKDKLQQATINYIVHFLTPPEEFTQMKDAFKALDKDGNGTLSV